MAPRDPVRKTVNNITSITVVNGAAPAAHDVFRYDSGTGNLYFDHDGNSGGDDVLIATLDTPHPASLIATDFNLVA